MKSIGFLEELQREVVARHKTETRRLTGPQPDDYLLNPRGDFILPDGSRADLLARYHLIRPRYKVGEVIYIKEPYIDDLDPDRVFYKYNPADIQALQDLGYGEYLDKPGFWRNKQSMPARLARYFLRITARHGERLQDITEEAAKREGVRPFASIEGHYVHYCPGIPNQNKRDTQRRPRPHTHNTFFVRRGRRGAHFSYVYMGHSLGRVGRETMGCSRSGQSRRPSL